MHNKYEKKIELYNNYYLWDSVENRKNIENINKITKLRFIEIIETVTKKPFYTNNKRMFNEFSKDELYKISKKMSIITNTDIIIIENLDHYQNYTENIKTITINDFDRLHKEVFNCYYVKNYYEWIWYLELLYVDYYNNEKTLIDEIPYHLISSYNFEEETFGERTKKSNEFMKRLTEIHKHRMRLL